MSGVSLRKEGFTKCARPLLSAIKRGADSGQADWRNNSFAIRIIHNPGGSFRDLLAVIHSTGAKMVRLPADDHTIVIATADAIAQFGRCKDISGIALVRTKDESLVRKIPEGTIVNFRQADEAASSKADANIRGLTGRQAPAIASLNAPAP